MNDTIPIHILLVEDDPSDVNFTSEALKESQVNMVMTVARDGNEALDMLFRRPPFDSARRPDLILLDLNLPRRDGREVLTIIKSDPGLCEIPVVVLTTSSDPDDIHSSYRAHANCFITKPIDLEQFARVVKVIEEFWFSIARLPKEAL
jgi:CheY-like chemotaxis protein